ncbi:hypothetical protein V5O48_010111 [Marasmius crinis-equi]|uniref:Uncharacterized protein n=1 Tax=Marasmius crinis-equi TaxID=585013 RepID=A0ABR3F9B5_9AGAR
MPKRYTNPQPQAATGSNESPSPMTSDPAMNKVATRRHGEFVPRFKTHTDQDGFTTTYKTSKQEISEGHFGSIRSVKKESYSTADSSIPDDFSGPSTRRSDQKRSRKGGKPLSRDPPSTLHSNSSPGPSGPISASPSPFPSNHSPFDPMYGQDEFRQSDDFLATLFPPSDSRQTVNSIPTPDDLPPSLETASFPGFAQTHPIKENYIHSLAVPSMSFDPSVGSEPSGASAVPYQQEPLLSPFTSQYPPFEHPSLPPYPNEWLGWQRLPDSSNATSHPPPHSSGSFDLSMGYQHQDSFPEGLYSQPPSGQQLYFTQQTYNQPQLPHHPMQFYPQQPETPSQLPPGQSPQVAQPFQTSQSLHPGSLPSLLQSPEIQPQRDSEVSPRTKQARQRRHTRQHNPMPHNRDRSPYPSPRTASCSSPGTASYSSPGTASYSSPGSSSYPSPAFYGSPSPSLPPPSPSSTHTFQSGVAALPFPYDPHPRYRHSLGGNDGSYNQPLHPGVQQRARSSSVVSFSNSPAPWEERPE